MSTDIVALEKQYAKLRRKQHHACVVISGIKPARAESDVDKDSPVSPGGPGLLEEEANNMESSVAMLTLSVPLETEKSNQDLSDPISPTVFGDTKCFFVQNLKKKTTEKHHPKRSKRSNKSDDNLHSDKPSCSEDGNESTAYHEDTSKKSNKKNKRVCFKDETDTVDVKETKDIHSEEQTFDNKSGSETIEQIQENDISDSQEVGMTETGEVYVGNGQKEIGCVETKVDTVSEEIDNDTGATENGFKIDGEFSDRIKQGNGTSGNGVKEIKGRPVEEEVSEKVEDEIDDSKTTSELNTNILKTSRTQGLRNPSLKYSKQYYPSNQISHKKHRTKSESAENTNKQSIYQHFNLTKRQLSLDSAFSGGNNKSAQAKSIEFPFPVHMINEHKIKAGMKLGLYDHKALEKLEKTRKIPKTKLPNLTFD